MTLPLSQPDRRRPRLALLLVLCLLFAQWLGLGHAVAHGNGLPDAGKISKVSAQAGSPIEHQKSAGNCAAIDAATLGAGVPMADFAVTLAPLADQPAVLPLRHGWHRLFTAHFSSRAPPLNA